MTQVCPLSFEDLTTPPEEEARLLDSTKIGPADKLAIRRALRNLSPDSRFLYRCVDESAKILYLGTECRTEESPSLECDCSTDSDLRAFYQLFKSKPGYSEDEIRCFAEVVRSTLEAELIRLSRGLDLRRCKRWIPDYVVVPFDTSTSGTSSDICSCVTSSSEELPQECWDRYAIDGQCKPRERKPVEFRHFGNLLRVPSAELEPPSEPFRVGYLGKSDEIGKWGRFYELVERVLFELAITRKKEPTCCDDVCAIMPVRQQDIFEDVRRFELIKPCCFARFCRSLMRWSSCVTKRWDCITRHPHQVIHLPSMSYPCELRCTAQRQFASLQNVQIGRLGWLVNRNAQVIYVCPGKSDSETERVLRNFVKTARPDVCLDNLTIIVNDEECLCTHVDENYQSGCESLFYTPRVYRRVRRLTSGRHGFIIPGVLCRTDVFIACELRTSIIGPCLKFQERLLNKHYVMSFLKESGVQHPPFAGVRDFYDLCETMARTIIGLTWRGRKKWLIKVNCGFCGKSSALICLDYDDCRMHGANEESLRRYLTNELPRTTRVNREAYKDAKDLFAEMERHGGVLTSCPDGDCRTVSLGCFIEHDTAEARLRTAADVLQSCSDCGWTDVGYVIPQTALPMNVVGELVLRLGRALLVEQYVGYFGVDLVVFRKEDGDVIDYWVVDLDPYYTDLISFDDWRRFCLDVPMFSRFDTESGIRKPNENHRFVVCSGKIYVDGLSRCSGDFFVDLCKEHKIAYSAKAKTGCMICPLDDEKRAFLLFAFCSDRRTALRYFVRALGALHSATLDRKKPQLTAKNRAVIKLARDIVKKFGLDNPN